MAIRQTIAELWRFNGFSKWRPLAILYFEKFEFLLLVRFRESICFILQILLAIGQTVTEI